MVAFWPFYHGGAGEELHSFFSVDVDDDNISWSAETSIITTGTINPWEPGSIISSPAWSTVVSTASESATIDPNTSTFTISSSTTFDTSTTIYSSTVTWSSSFAVSFTDSSIIDTMNTQSTSGPTSSPTSIEATGTAIESAPTSTTFGPAGFPPTESYPSTALEPTPPWTTLYEPSTTTICTTSSIEPATSSAPTNPTVTTSPTPLPLIPQGRPSWLIPVAATLSALAFTLILTAVIILLHRRHKKSQTPAEKPARTRTISSPVFISSTNPRHQPPSPAPPTAENVTVAVLPRARRILRRLGFQDRQQSQVNFEIVEPASWVGERRGVPVDAATNNGTTEGSS